MSATANTHPPSTDPLNTDGLQTGDRNIGTRSLRAGSVTMASQVAQLLIQVGSTAVLARLLVPDDFGIVAMASSLTAFATVFRDVGLSHATIQKSELTHSQVNMMFWANVATGGVLTTLVAVLAPAIAAFYQKPEVMWVTVSMSVTFIIGSLGIQHGALMTRAMRFKAIAVIQILAALFGASAAIAAAYIGFGYWSLVLRIVIAAIATLALRLCYTRWTPTRPALSKDVRELFQFGAHVTAFNVVNYFSRNLDNIVIGRVWGAAALGFYSRAYSLMMLPISNLRNPLQSVAFPALSRLQNDPTRFRNYYCQYAALLAFGSMPVVAFLFVCSDNTINLVLGPAWAPAAEIFQILAVMAFIQPASSSRGVVMLSTGNTRRYFRSGLYGASAYSAAFLVGVYWGAKGVALSYVIVGYASVYPGFRYAFRDTPLAVTDFFKAIARPAVSAVAAVGLTAVVHAHLPLAHDLAILAACAPVFGLMYLLTFFLLPGGAGILRRYLAYGTVLLRSRT